MGLFENRKKITKKYKQLKKIINSDKYFQEDNVFLNEKGQAVLQLNVEKYNNVVSDYCMPNYEIFDQAFAEFIIDNVEYVDIKHDLVIEMFFNDELNEKQQTIVKKTLKRHFAERIATTKEDLQESHHQTLAFSIFGLLIFALAYVFNRFIGKIDLIYEIFAIGGWFFLWEAIDNVFYNSLKLKQSLITDARIWNAEIVIKKLNTNALTEETTNSINNGEE